MKKLIFVLASLFIALPAFAIENGEQIDGVNYCTKVNRYDISKVTSISFPDSSLIWFRK